MLIDWTPQLVIFANVALAILLLGDVLIVVRHSGDGLRTGSRAFSTPKHTAFAGNHG